MKDWLHYLVCWWTCGHLNSLYTFIVLFKGTNIIGHWRAVPRTYFGVAYNEYCDMQVVVHIVVSSFRFCMLLQASFCAPHLQVAGSLAQVQTAVVGSLLFESAAPVVHQSVISERPWGGGSGFCGAHCLLSIYALGYCRFLVLFWPAAQPPSLSAQPPASPGELTHSVNNTL